MATPMPPIRARMREKVSGRNPPIRKPRAKPPMRVWLRYLWPSRRSRRARRGQSGSKNIAVAAIIVHGKIPMPNSREFMKWKTRRAMKPKTRVRRLMRRKTYDGVVGKELSQEGKVGAGGEPRSERFATQPVGVELGDAPEEVDHPYLEAEEPHRPGGNYRRA